MASDSSSQNQTRVSSIPIGFQGHRFKTSRIASLPRDVTKNIFDAFILLFDENSSHHRMFAASPLTHVNQRWREIALSTGSLWTTLHVVPRSRLPSDVHKAERRLSAVQAIIQRSKESYLTVHVDLTFATGPTDELTIVTAFSTSSRWRELRVTPSDNEITQKFFGQIVGNLPELLSLNLANSGPYNETFKLPYFTPAPKLETLHIEGSCSLDHISLPWQQLTVAKCNSHNVFYDLLQRSPNLTKVTLHDLKRDQSQRLKPGLSSFIHNNLRTLETGFDSAHLLVKLCLPSLVEFKELYQPRQQASRYVSLVLALRDTALQCRLRTLSLSPHTECDQGQKSFGDMLRISIGDLEVLSLTESPRPLLASVSGTQRISYISYLYVSPSPPSEGVAIPAPSLKELHYKFSGDFVPQSEVSIFYLKTILQVVQSRRFSDREGLAKLERFTCESKVLDPTAHAFFMDGLRELRKDGMKVVLRFKQEQVDL